MTIYLLGHMLIKVCGGRGVVVVNATKRCKEAAEASMSLSALLVLPDVRILSDLVEQDTHNNNSNSNNNTTKANQTHKKGTRRPR
jgi:hypothetical protein